VALGAPSSGNQVSVVGREAVDYYAREIARLQRQTWHWQRVMGVPVTPKTPTRKIKRRLAGMDGHEIKRAAGIWRQRSDAVYRRAQRPPHLREFLCIHRYEASWTDSGDPYWGGLQMDRSFQRAYGGYLLEQKGLADNWSPLEQIWAAERALRSRGFYPWPNTARYCGLL
jgi:hypothetical protein